MRNQNRLRIHRIQLPITSSISKRRRPAIHMVIAGQPQVIFFAGVGNEKNSLIRIAKLLQNQGITNIAVAGPMPYWHVPATKEDIQNLAITGIVTAVGYVKSLTDTPVLHGIAESQSSGALIHAIYEHPTILSGNIGLLRPLGLTILNKKELVRGLRQSITHADQLFDWRAWPVGMTASWRLMQDRLRHNGKQFELGIGWDISKELKTISRQRPGQIRIFAAENDHLYTLKAIKSSFASRGMPDILEVIPGIHASPATRAGSLQVAHVVRWCQSNLVAV